MRRSSSSGYHSLPANAIFSQDENPAVEGGARPIVQDAQPMEDSLIMLWDVVSTLHDSGWHEDELPRAVPRLWKASTVESKLSNLSSLSLLEDFVAADTIPVYFTRMGPCEMIATAGDHGGSSRCEVVSYERHVLAILSAR